MMLIKDYIHEPGNADVTIMIQGVNPDDEYDPWVETYYHGKIDSVPVKYIELPVLTCGWSMQHKCDVLLVPYVTVG